MTTYLILGWRSRQLIFLFRKPPQLTRSFKLYNVINLKKIIQKNLQKINENINIYDHAPYPGLPVNELQNEHRYHKYCRQDITCKSYKTVSVSKLMIVSALWWYKTWNSCHLNRKPLMISDSSYKCIQVTSNFTMFQWSRSLWCS